MIRETSVPGVGRKFVLEHSRGADLVAVVHHDGKRELFRRDDEHHERLLTLDDETARLLGGILSGIYHQPDGDSDTGLPVADAASQDADETSAGDRAATDDAFIDWVEVPEDSPVAGATLDESGVWRETGATVLAVRRDEETRPSPDPEFTVEGGDVLVTLGARDEQAALDALVRDT